MLIITLTPIHLRVLVLKKTLNKTVQQESILGLAVINRSAAPSQLFIMKSMTQNFTLNQPNSALLQQAAGRTTTNGQITGQAMHVEAQQTAS